MTALTSARAGTRRNPLASSTGRRLLRALAGSIVLAFSALRCSAVRAQFGPLAEVRVARLTGARA